MKPVFTEWISGSRNADSFNKRLRLPRSKLHSIQLSSVQFKVALLSSIAKEYLDKLLFCDVTINTTPSLFPLERVVKESLPVLQAHFKLRLARVNSDHGV